jgi:serine kinase of HPr protein (carbohydrate metabolism regulator)
MTETPSTEAPRNVHATGIRIGTLGILIRGPARSGKSSLALSTLRGAEAAGLQAALVADDQVFLERAGSGLEMVAPASTRGLIEISGVGLLEEHAIERAGIGLLVDLLDPASIERLPAVAKMALAGVEIDRIALSLRSASLGADILVSLAKRPRNDDLNQF